MFLNKKSAVALISHPGKFLSGSLGKDVLYVNGIK
jgi:hypothetical protein